MAPSPITLIEHNLQAAPSLFRGILEGSQDHFDLKAVGSHLPLGKRNSTPVGVGVNNPYAALKMGLPPPHPFGPQVSEAPSLQQHHRSLDRCHSEPSKPPAPQQQQQQQQQPAAATSSSRYKTELCRPFAETGFCKYGEKCQFAHGASELRNMPRHPKYKTELCRTFHTTGLCVYGTRCHFIHNADERRNPSPLAFSPRSPDDLSPPASVHGSPTSSAGAFFGDAFSMSSPHDDPFCLLSLETPPVSPVESLAGDIESLSLSPALSDSPTPPGMPPHAHQAGLGAFMDSNRYLRLPIFESLKEAM